MNAERKCDECKDGAFTHFPCGCWLSGDHTYHPRVLEDCTYTPGYAKPVPCPKCKKLPDPAQFAP